ncbi:PREDICTED: cyclin-dependent kinase inhibitor 1B-like [Poecilia mexicana]|uniref:cyclin-dependent kinase inhibitor 1B-like n=1 Tax=Poecilia mexicana TaxID=48701 RepID=UPI00072E5339|nr:PREDICTED: cyclin-dependent kinase inhibitor 1B-like [Poecilia mexicana]
MCNNMSDVRLSNASPTVERVDARQLDNARSVRRVLFGTPDPEETRKQAEALQLQSVEAFRDKYNFDPVEDRPLSPGLYDWQEDEDAPEFYRRPPRWSQPPRGEAGEGSRETRRERRSPHTKGSRKRSFQSAGHCSNDCTSNGKKSHSDKDDDEEQALGAGSQAEQQQQEEEEVPC